MEKTSTAYSHQDQLEKVRKSLLKVSPEARARLIKEHLDKRKTRSTQAPRPAFKNGPGTSHREDRRR